MKATGYKAFSVKLELDDLESRWLKDIMQNPLNETKQNDESKINRIMRGKFFNALKEAGIR